jgi:hypothetical protein
VVICNGQYDVMDPATFHCYYDTVADGFHSTWQEGRDWCINTWGGDLVSINDPGELAFVQGLASNQYSEHRWTGANDIQNEGTFVWADGSAVTYPANMAPWAPGQPSGSDCVVLQANGGLAAVNCNGDGLTHHMCERVPVGQ